MTAYRVGDPYPTRPLTFGPADALHSADGRVTVVSCLDLCIDPVALLGLPRRRLDLVSRAGSLLGGHELRAIRASQDRLGARHLVLLDHEDCLLVDEASWGMAALQRLEHALHAVQNADLARGIVRGHVVEQGALAGSVDPAAVTT